MLPLALMTRDKGFPVSGCDRAFDLNPDDERISVLRAAGVEIVSEKDPPAAPATCVVSSAIEEGHPALRNAKSVMHRSDLLKEELLSFASRRESILVAGSSGKSSTTAMTGWILRRAGLDPFIYMGARVRDLCPYGFRAGHGPVVAEVDESDGSIEKFDPSIGVVTSVSEDHHSLEEVWRLFREFISKADVPVVASELAGELGLSGGFEPLPEPASPLPGRFNRMNEALAVEAAVRAGVPRLDALGYLRDFPGVARRLEVVAKANGSAVIDDFAHNPEKIAASLEAVTQMTARALVIFQPHGFTPTRMHAQGWAAAFDEGLRPDDHLLLLPIFDVGGVAQRDVSSEDIFRNIHRASAALLQDKEAVVDAAKTFLEKGPGVVALFGARDPGLAAFAKKIAAAALPSEKTQD